MSGSLSRATTAVAQALRSGAGWGGPLPIHPLAGGTGRTPVWLARGITEVPEVSASDPPYSLRQRRVCCAVPSSSMPACHSSQTSMVHC